MGGWFGVGFRPGVRGAGLEPVRVGGAGPEPVRTLRPSWSFVAVVGRAGRVWLERPGQEPGRAAAVLAGAWRDVLPSETHVVVVARSGALEAWRLGPGPALDGPEAAWRREAGAEEEEEAAALELPLVAGGFVEARPPAFFRPLWLALRARQLALGHEHALLLAADGRLFSWGAGRHGQLGHGDLESAAEARPVEALEGVPMGQVAASLGEAGDLYVWGWNESGQLGLPSKAMPEGPSGEAKHSGRTPSSGPVAPEESPFISIQAFPALLDLPGQEEVSKSRLRVERSILEYKVGIVETIDTIPSRRLRSRCLNRALLCLSGAGVLYTWGWGKYGQLGHRDTATSDRPKKVCSFEALGLGVADVVCGPWTTFVLAVPEGCRSAACPEEP